MASIDALLDGPRAKRAFLLKAVFAGKWSITVEDRAPLSVIVMASGRATVTGPDGPHRVSAGDVVLARGPRPYTIADSASTAADIRILPGQLCVDPRGTILAETMRLGVRTWGNTRDPDATVMLIGTYERETAVGALLLSRLPESAMLGGFDPDLTAMLSSELVCDRSGQSAVLDRLLDLVVVKAVRAILDGQRSGPADELVATALSAMEDHPEHPWTVQTLGALVGLSRAALARRFSSAVGEPPLTYLTRWRLALAADLLVGTELTLSAIANRVGYANAFALSAAFKRGRGTSPTLYRAAHLT